MPLEDQQGADPMSPPPSDTQAFAAGTGNLDVTSPSSGGTDVTPLSSSGSEADAPGKIDGPASLEDAIAAALDADADPKPANPGENPDADADDADAPSDKAADGSDKSDGTVDEGSASEDADIPEEEISRYGKNAQRRIRELLDSRVKMRQEITSLQGDATSYKQIRQFMDTNSLVDADVADLFRVGADLKSGHPERVARALDRMLPLVQQAMELTGRALPKDLSDQVENGEMTEAAARQMARTRTDAAYAQQQAQQARQQAQQQQVQVAQGQILSAVDQWTQQIRQADPDFDLKADAMKRAAQALVYERGLPKSPAEAVEYAKAAHAEASRWMKSARPAPKPSRPAPTSQAAPRAGLAPAASSLEAIISQALQG